MAGYHKDLMTTIPAKLISIKVIAAYPTWRLPQREGTLTGPGC